VFKLQIPPGVTFKYASVQKQFESVKVIDNSDEVIYDKIYITAIVNDRLVKFLKESVSYK